MQLLPHYRLLEFADWLGDIVGYTQADLLELDRGGLQDIADKYNKSLESLGHKQESALGDSLYYFLQREAYYNEEDFDVFLSYLEKTHPPQTRIARLQALQERLEQAASPHYAFLAWLRKGRKTNVNILGSIPVVQVNNLVRKFCEETNYGDEQALVQDVLRWQRGDIDKFVAHLLFQHGTKLKLYSENQQSPTTHYQIIAYHGLFLFPSGSREIISKLIVEKWRDLNSISGQWLDIYYTPEDLKIQNNGYELHEDSLKSLNLTLPELPAFVLWQEKISESYVISISTLSADQIVNVIRNIVYGISKGENTFDIVREARVVVDKAQKRNRPWVIIEEVTMEKYEFKASGNARISNVVVGKNNNIINSLTNAGQEDLAKTLAQLTQAVMESKNLPDDQKEDQIGQINAVGEEAKKDKPNKAMLKSLVDGLLSALKVVPDITSAANTAAPIIEQFFKKL